MKIKKAGIISALLFFVFTEITQSAHAFVVYSGPQDVAFPQGSNESVFFSFMGEPENDMEFFNFSEVGFAVRFADEDSSYATSVVLLGRSLGVLSIDAGTEINDDIGWTTVRADLARYAGASSPGGLFFDREAFMSVRFTDVDSVYYGWIRVSHSVANEQLVLRDWAWNSTPGEPILAGEIPEPAAYAMIIGVGALLVVFLRRRYFSRGGAGARW